LWSVAFFLMLHARDGEKHYALLRKTGVSVPVAAYSPQSAW